MMEFLEFVPLNQYTTFRTGGPARYFCHIRSVADIVRAREFAKEKGLPLFVLGGGSNLLVSDSGINAVVAKMEIMGRKFREVDHRFSEFIVGAGENWDDAVALCVSKGLYGIENLSGIPGTVGAAPVQNIGAYGTEIRETLARVNVFDLETGEEKILNNEECKFSYRNSIFKTKEGKRYVIVGVTLLLDSQGRVNIGYKDLKERFKDSYSKDVSLNDLRSAVLDIRKNKLPDIRECGTAGSFFKNPIIPAKKFAELNEKYPDMPNFPLPNGDVKIPLAWILDNVCGLKGFQDGPVGLYKTQPLALINLGTASSQDVLNLVARIKDIVREKTGILIEEEVIIV